MKTIDVKNQSLGRAASRAAALLRGKDSVDFQPNIVPSEKITILNVSKIKLTGRKMVQKKYKRYSGYPGGLKYTPMKKVFENNPAEVFKRAVWGMLPKNKLRAQMIKNLITKNGN